jgi:HEAT repeat protein/type 1 glutamine amidotransferase
VLIFSGLNNHDWRSTTPVLEQMIKACDRFGVVAITEEPGKCDAAAFAKYDVVISNWTPYPDTARQWPEATEKAFLDFVGNGGGFVVFHAAACTFQVWPEFQQIIALTWKEQHTGHTAYSEFRVEVADKDHPITRGMKDFYMVDELYQNMAQMADQKLNVACQAFAAKELGGTGKFEPVLVWTRYGKGRGVNLVLGHDAAAMRNVGFRTLLLRGAEWAATGTVTIPILANWPGTASAGAVSGIDPGEALKAVAGYTQGRDRKPLVVVEQLVRAAAANVDAASSAMQNELAAGIAAMLSSDATVDAKSFLCRQLALIGTEAEVPTLASLLGDEALTFSARYALERIPGPAAHKALRDALAAAGGGVKLGIVNSIGERRDPEAVPGLAALLYDPDGSVAAAAAGALGKIGGESATSAIVDALSTTSGEVRAAVADACLACAHGQLAAGRREAAAAVYRRLYAPEEPVNVRTAALRGLVAADYAEGLTRVGEALNAAAGAEADPMMPAVVQLAREAPGKDATRLLVSRVSAAAPAVQALLLDALGDRGDRLALSVVVEKTRGEETPVRVAALTALGKLGDASNVDLLTNWLADPREPEREAARRSLSLLRGANVNEAIVRQIAKPGATANTRVDLIRTLAARHATETVMVLMKTVQGAESATRVASWKALKDLAGPQDLPDLLALLERAGADVREEAENTIVALAQRSAEGPLDASGVLAEFDAGPDVETRCSLLRVLGGIGTDDALPKLREALKGGDPAIRDTAVRVLSAWPAATVLPDLLEVARTTDQDVHRTLALRGVARVCGLVKDRPPDQVAEWLADGLKSASGPEEKKALLGELGRHPCLTALRLALAFLQVPGLVDEAGQAAVQAASPLADASRDAVKSAMKQVIGEARSPDLIKQADAVQRKAAKPVNLALGATASSPDNLDKDGAAGGDQAAIDGNPDTYWDEVDGQPLYRLVVTFKEPTKVSAVNIQGHAYQSFSPKDFEILCDDAVVKTVREAAYDRNTNEVLVDFPRTRFKTLELKITGYYGGSPAIRELEIYNMPETEPSATATPVPPQPDYHWRQTNASLALLDHDRVVWQFNYPKDAAKPYFHPVTLGGDVDLTCLSPPDHPWHRALWFSWKEINGVNYWEEDAATGQSQGRTEIVSAKVVPGNDYSARIEMDLAYHPPDQPAVLTEKRLLTVSPPTPDGSYHIDWRAGFTAGPQDVLLQGGTAGGGYAGLSVRVAQKTRDWRLVDSEGREDTAGGGTAKNTHGQKARWMDFSLVDMITGRTAGVAVLDHPRNLRHPSPWHNVMDDNILFGYFSPAPLWNEPYTLPAGKTLTLRYRVLIHPGRADKDRLQREWRHWGRS